MSISVKVGATDAVGTKVTLVILIPGGSNNPPVIGNILSQNLPIGGIGLTRGITMAADGTILTWNDSVGPYKGNTASIPGTNTAPFTPWRQAINGGGATGNFPSNWLQSPTPYIGQGCYSIACPSNNSNFVYAMICGESAEPVTYLFKSTDGCSTWTLTNFPVNSLDSNGGQPGVFSQSICIDPNNNSNAWVTGDSNVLVTLDGGSTWNSCASLPTAQCFAMAFDPTTPNRLIVGSLGNGLYVSTNANLGTSATFTHITSSIASPGEGRFGSDGVYYCTNGATKGGIYRVIGTTFVQIFTDSSVDTYTVAIDPNNPARVFSWSSQNNGVGNGPLVMNTTAANTGSPSFTTQGDKAMPTSTPDSPLVGISFNNINGTGVNGNTFLTNGTGLWFDPWTTTSVTTINLSSLSSGGTTGVIVVPAGISNITVGRQLRCTNTGTPANYFIFNVASYSGTSLQGTIISAAQGGYLGGPIGGTTSASAWTISAERVYMNSGPGGGPTFVDGFVSGTQTIKSCAYGLEGSAILDVVWPVGGNPILVTQDRGIFPIVRNPWNAGAGVVDGYGYGQYQGLNQSNNIAVSPANPAFWIAGSDAGFLTSSGGGIVGTWNATANQPAAGVGPVACANANVFLSCGGPGAANQGIQYTQNAGGSAWTNMPSPAPTSGWAANAPFQNSHVLDLDTTTTGPFVFYGWNSGDSFVYQMSVPAAGTPTVTKKGSTSATGLGPGTALKCVSGNAGHLFWAAGEISNSHTLATVFSDHPNGASAGFTRLQFSKDQGATWTQLTTTQEVITVGLGPATTGGSGYPTIGAIGWCGGGQYGFYVCTNFNPLSLGSETWTLVTNYIGTYGLSTPISCSGDPNQQGRWIIGTNGNGAVILQRSGLANGWF